MSRQRSLFLTLFLVTTPVPALAESNDFAGLVDIGGGRKMYLECRGTGVPAVVIVAGGKASADDWTVSAPGSMNVFSAVAEFTRVCAYDRPGTPVGEAPSRSDPVAQPTTAANSVADLHALLGAAGIATPVVLVGHSYGGLVVRLYAMTHPGEVAGMVLVDALSEGLRAAETPDEWAIQRVLLEGDLTESLKLYPDLERGDADRSFDQLLAAAPLKPMPLVVLSADHPWGPLVPGMIADGLLPADVPPDFGYVTDRAQKEAQAKLAALVPGAKHITDTDSGHEIHKDQPQLVIDSIRDVVDAVRESKAWLVPRFEPAPCPKVQGAEALADASCGYLVVPENRSQATGRTIRLFVATYPARSPEKRPDPVVFLAGGPGDISPWDVNELIAADFIRDRDIVLMAQRGTWLSEPALTCASIDDFNRELLGLRFYSEATKRAHLAATEACHRELAATGADLSAYNSTESAADFADLRTVLGYAAWNVYGLSYGSYLAQTLMRDHPDGIRSVVLDSVLPTTYTVAANWEITRSGFDNLFQACAAEPACNAAHPHLEETFTGLVNKLEAEPLTITVSDPATGEDLEVVLDGGALVDWLRNQNYAVPLLQAAPNRIDGLAANRAASIEAIAKSRVERAPPSDPDVPAISYGLALGVSCREDYPFATPEDLAAAGQKAFPDYPASIRDQGVGGWAYFNEDCRDVWKVPAAPEAMHQPVASSIPTLLISGSFDTLTSLAGAEAAAASLSDATIISIPGIGHVVAPKSPCAQAVIVSFLADPHAPDTSCVAGLKPQPFAAPESP